jgi:hypothetical protein
LVVGEEARDGAREIQLVDGVFAVLTKATVLVLGAGASCPYGFPAAAKLSDDVITFARGSNPRGGLVDQLKIDRAAMSALADTLVAAGAPSVDWLLERRPEFTEVGKLLMAILLHGCEQDSRLQAYPRSDADWYHYLWTELDTSLDGFAANPLTVVTFNYDRSFERFLFLRLKALHNMEDDAALELAGKLPVIHVYGALGDARYEDVPYNERLNVRSATAAASRIKILHEGQLDAPELTSARTAIRAAKNVGFLGFSFGRENCERLDLEAASKDTDKAFFGSRMGLTLPEFRRRVPRWTTSALGHTADLSDRFLDGDCVFTLKNTRLIG